MFVACVAVSVDVLVVLFDCVGLLLALLVAWLTLVVFGVSVVYLLAYLL